VRSSSFFIDASVAFDHVSFGRIRRQRDFLDDFVGSDFGICSRSSGMTTASPAITMRSSRSSNTILSSAAITSLRDADGSLDVPLVARQHQPPVTWCGSSTPWIALSARGRAVPTTRMRVRAVSARTAAYLGYCEARAPAIEGAADRRYRASVPGWCVELDGFKQFAASQAKIATHSTMLQVVGEGSVRFAEVALDHLGARAAGA